MDLKKDKDTYNCLLRKVVHKSPSAKLRKHRNASVQLKKNNVLYLIAGRWPTESLMVKERIEVN